eukprot:m.78205 g.78205  ORF g.78205 m.78205 type:complete len:296 (-) comp14575_c0_seq2:129-1016(-)
MATKGRKKGGSGGTVVYGPPELFAKEMRRIINDPEFSDIQFVVGQDKDKIYAHKIILAGRCEVFRAMFAEQKPKSKRGSLASEPDAPPLVLPEVRPTVFLTVLEFIYTNSCSLQQAIVVDVLASAVEYGLQGLVLSCVEFISQGLSVDTACEAMQAAITYKQTDLRDLCMQFIEDNTEPVFKSRTFVEMSEDTLAYILQSDKLEISEKEVLTAVKEWGTVNSVVSGRSLGEVCATVIEHVRFPLLDAETLTKLEAENEKQQLVPVRLVAKAWKFHATHNAEPGNKQYVPRSGSRQ